MKTRFYLQFLLLIFLTSSLSAQNKYYKISFVDLIPPEDPKKKEYLEDADLQGTFKNIIVTDEEYVLTFEDSGKYLDAEIEDFFFTSVTLFHPKSFRIFEKSNRSTNPPFEGKGLKMINTDKLIIHPTGNTKTINSKLCHEYKQEYPTQATYFVDKSLPFINYKNFPTTLPGFVTSYTTRNYGINVTVIRKLEEINYDEKYFKFINEFKKTFPSLISYNEDFFSHESTVPEYIVEFSNQEYLNSYYYKKGMEEYHKTQNLHIKNKFVSHDKSNWEAFYFDNDHRQIFKIEFKSNGTQKDPSPAPEMIGDSTYIEYRKEGSISTKSTIHKSNQTHEYEFVSLGSKFFYSLNKRGQPISSTYFERGEKLTSKTDYKYDQKHQLISTTTNELLKNQIKEFTYAYHPNGLLMEMIKFGDTTTINYIFKPGIEMDTLHILDKKSSETRLVNKIFHYDKKGQIRIKNTTGRYSDHWKYDYSYFDNEKSQSFFDPENQLRIKYLELFCKADSIKSKIFDSREKKAALDNLSSHQFATLQLKNTPDRNSIANYLTWFPDIEILQLEVIHKDDNYEYYKASYKETLTGFINKERGDYHQSLNFLSSTFGKNTVEIDPITWTFKLEIDSRYLIIKKSIINNKWLIDLQ